MNSLQKLAIGATAAAVPAKLLARSAGRAMAHTPSRIRPVLQPPRPTPKAATMPGLQHAEGFIPAPKLPKGADKNLTLAGSQEATKAYSTMPQDLRGAIEQSDLVRAGVPPATALALAHMSMQKATRRGIASGVPQNISKSLSRYMTGGKRVPQKRLSTAMAEAPTAAGTLPKYSAAHWTSFGRELRKILNS